MAKRWRDVVAADKRGNALKRRTHNPGGVGTLEDDETTKRRRIAGERPAAGADTAAKPTDATASEKQPADSDTGSNTGSESQRLANKRATKPITRTAVINALWATLTGLIVGAALTGLVYAGMQAFQAIYNTPAGDGVGAAVLVVVLVISMLVGRSLLKWRGLHDPNATTLLGVLLMLIVTLAALLPIVFSSWMLLITPLLGAVTYLLSHLLVTHFGSQK